MRSPDSVSLTASELGYLWTGTAINDMTSWFLRVLHQHAADVEIKQLLASALQMTNEFIDIRKQLLTDDNYTLPLGFGASDVRFEAPVLFTDRFMLQYLKIAIRFGLEFHSKSLALAARTDVRECFALSITKSVQLVQQIKELLLQKGMFWRTPSLPSGESPEVIQKRSYLNGWFGDTRSLNSMELANLYDTMEMLALMESLCMGFAQTSEAKDAKQLFLKGRSIARDQFHSLSKVLLKDNLPIPPTFEAEISDSTINVFSDRLMVCHIAGYFGSIITQAGYSLGSSMKHDLVKLYTTLIGEVGIFAEKITSYLIDNEWLDKVPGAVDREALLDV
ncbi:DUF3231 family protein [Paenibacillus tarimensis]|uniref:DUF3231 family protein n=1 Tax=Paenibacillus tarimensis TaxID=416012 RepID=UPI001F2B9AA1|nr:DUF3231 family protein [Paenibacillus tarimensis]MCF2946023.1 DUF3231 family protein [Paenibacillus tarimensis]